MQTRELPGGCIWELRAVPPQALHRAGGLTGKTSPTQKALAHEEQGLLPYKMFSCKRFSYKNTPVQDTQRNAGRCP